MSYESCKIVLLVPVALLLYGGCADESPMSPAGDVEMTRVSKNTVAITAESGLRLREVDGTRYTYYVGRGAPRISEGDVIVGGTGGGYVRKVVSAQYSGSELVLDTYTGHLTDAVEFGGTDTLAGIGFGSAAFGGEAASAAGGMQAATPSVLPTGGGLDLRELVLFSGEVEGVDALVTIPSGRLEFNPDLVLDISIRAKHVKKFKVIADGLLTFDCDVDAAVSGAVSLQNEVPIASATRKVVQYIGRVPVVAMVTLDVSVEFVLIAPAAADYQVGCNGQVELRMGGAYENGRWSAVNTVGEEYASHPFESVSPDAIHLRLYFKTQCTVRYYDSGNGTILTRPYFEFDSEVNQIDIIEWEQYGGMNVLAEFHGGLLDDQLPGYVAPPFEVRRLIDSGPFSTDDYIFITEWGEQGGGEGQFNRPQGIALDAEGNVYVVDTDNHRIVTFTSDGVFLDTWGTYGTDIGRLYFPYGIAIGPAGNVYITEPDLYRVQKFGSDGTYLTHWGGKGNGDGQFEEQLGIAVDADTFVYIVDNFLHRVQKFNALGDHVTTWGGQGSGNSQLLNPVGITVDPGGSLLVTECGNHRISKFSPVGDYIMKWGSFGSDDGAFNCPVDIAVDSDGYVYVSDYGNDRIQKFTPEGVFVNKLGTSGTGPGQFDRPRGMTEDGAGNIYIVDSRNHRIQKFAPKPR